MLALGLPTGPVTAVLMAALLIHGVPPGPQLVNEHPHVFWGFIASMYVGNLMLLALNLPLVGLFVNVLRIPYAYLYPLIIMFCIIGVYEVNHSIVDVWIMLIMGVVGYRLRKFDFDPAPLVLGLVIAPLFEMSLRQSLIMSNGDWMIFFQRPICARPAADLRGAAGDGGLVGAAPAQGLAQQAGGRRGRRRHLIRAPVPPDDDTRTARDDPLRSAPSFNGRERPRWQGHAGTVGRRSRTSPAPVRHAGRRTSRTR